MKIKSEAGGQELLGECPAALGGGFEQMMPPGATYPDPAWRMAYSMKMLEKWGLRSTAT